MQQELLKTERKTVSRERREAEKQRQFELKQQKRKEKHRGDSAPVLLPADAGILLQTGRAFGFSKSAKKMIKADHCSVSFDFTRIILGPFQQRACCAHCESNIAASDRQKFHSDSQVEEVCHFLIQPDDSAF